MHVATIKGEPRTMGTRHKLRKLRGRGFVPAIVYGHEQTPEAIALDSHDLHLALDRMAHVVKVVIDGAEQQYLLKDVQYDHFQSTPIHVDLMRADPNERVRVDVPIELRGEPAGVQDGGVLVQVMTHLEIYARLLDIPEQIRQKVDHLGLNETLSVKDLQLPEGVEAADDPDGVVASVTSKRGPSEAEAATGEGEEGGPTEPEVIGRVAKEDSEDGD